MHVLRAFLRQHRRTAAVLVALALCLKALLPVGYMIGGEAKVLTIEICGDATGANFAKKISIPMSGKAGQHDNDQAKVDGQCAFSAFSQASLPGADPALLAAALVFVLSLGFAPLRPAPTRRTLYLRPPLRGPPASA